MGWREGVLEKAADQHGLITRAQARAVGLSARACDRMVSSGKWLPVQAGVYRLPGTTGSHQQELLGACLASGGVASHRAAAALLGIPRVEYQPEITVVNTRRIQLKGVVVHRATKLDWVDKAWVDGIPVTSAARTVIDLASVLSRQELEAVVDHVLANRRAPLAYIRARVFALGVNGRKGARRLLDVLGAREGQAGYADSEPQRALDRLLADHDLPAGISEYAVHLPDGRSRRMDKGWPEAGVALQIDSYKHHSTLRDHTSDITRDNEAVLAGLRVLRVTPDQIKREPAKVAELIGRAIGPPVRSRDAHSS